MYCTDFRLILFQPSSRIWEYYVLWTTTPMLPNAGSFSPKKLTFPSSSLVFPGYDTRTDPGRVKRDNTNLLQEMRHPRGMMQYLLSYVYILFLIHLFIVLILRRCTWGIMDASKMLTVSEKIDTRKTNTMGHFKFCFPLTQILDKRVRCFVCCYDS